MSNFALMCTYKLVCSDSSVFFFGNIAIGADLLENGVKALLLLFQGFAAVVIDFLGANQFFFGKFSGIVEEEELAHILAVRIVVGLGAFGLCSKDSGFL